VCQYLRWLVAETSGLALESIIWLFAFVLIWDLNARLQRRVKLLLIFATRLMYVIHALLTGDPLTFACSLIPIIAVRLARLRPSIYQRTIEDIVEVNVLVQLALHWALTSECLTCLKPFLQTWHESVPADSSTSQYWGALSGMLSNSSTKGPSGADKTYTHASRPSKHAEAEDEDVDGVLKLRADKSGFSTRIVSEKKQTRLPEAEADDNIELLPMSRIRVEMTTTMTLS
jgi:hypothetical protein